MLARLLDAGLERPPTLRWVLLGGGPIAPALLERAEHAGVPVAPTYGTTEACSQIATFGWPLPGVELRLAAEDEILVRGPIVAAAALADDGWLHTGDLGRFDDALALEITGRKADTIVSGGENVSPAEVEAVAALALRRRRRRCVRPGRPGVGGGDRRGGCPPRRRRGGCRRAPGVLP